MSVVVAGTVVGRRKRLVRRTRWQYRVDGEAGQSHADRDGERDRKVATLDPAMF
jgi:hypothetical protein